MQKKIKLKVLILLAFVHTSKAQFNYPATQKNPVINNYFGVNITDNYQWLENLTDTTVKSWIKTQANFSNNIIDRISGRDTLIKRVKEFQKMNGEAFLNVVQSLKTYYFTKTKKNESLSKLYSRALPNGKEELLFDPETVGKNTQIIDFVIDEDGKNIALKLSSNGSEICQARILNIKTKKVLDDNFGPIWSEFTMQFIADDNQIVYTKMKSIDNKSDDVLKNMDVYIHTIGTTQEKDRLIFSREKYSELNILPERFPEISMSANKKYLFLDISSVKSEKQVFYANANELNHEKINWKPFLKYEDEVTDYYLIGNQVFFLTYKNAPRFKIGVTNMLNPNFNYAKIVVPESNQVIKDIQNTKDYIVYGLTDGISKDKYLLNPKTFMTKKLPLPSGVNTSTTFNALQNNKLLVYNSNWLSPNNVYELDIETNKIAKTKWFGASDAFPDFNENYLIKEVEVKSHDGVMVPLSIIYPKNIQLNGNTPCYLSGYGAYGISRQPRFIRRLSVLLEQGCCIAFAHPRGGGEKGKEWHKAGMKNNKRNTWKDFIACAEYLISEKYTSSQKLIGEGMSAGGILIGRAITERPDLFAVAICEVGMTNVLRNETTSNGDNQIPEIGSVKVEEDIKGLIEMDVQSKVSDNVKYPAIFIRSGMNDARVSPWMPAKLAAAFQNSTISNKPVLLYVNYGNGHFTSDVDVNNREFADMIAFSLWQVGHPKFKKAD